MDLSGINNISGKEVDMQGNRTKLGYLVIGMGVRVFFWPPAC